MIGVFHQQMLSIERGYKEKYNRNILKNKGNNKKNFNKRKNYQKTSNLWWKG